MVAQRSASRAPQLLPPCGRALRKRGDGAGRTQSSAMCALAGHRPPAPKAPNPRRVVRERAVDWVLDGRTVGESADALGLPVSAGFRFSPAGFAGRSHLSPPPKCGHLQRSAHTFSQGGPSGLAGLPAPACIHMELSAEHKYSHFTKFIIPIFNTAIFQ